MSGDLLAGIGAVTAYGRGATPLWDGVSAGVSAGRMQDVDGIDALVARVPVDELDDAATTMEAAVFAAVDEATADAAARGWVHSGTIGVIHCTGIGDIALARDGYFRDRRLRPSMFPHLVHTTAPSLVAQRLGADGPNTVVNAACASANVALLLARSWITTGWCEHVVVTAAEFCIIREVVHGFRQLNVLVDQGDPLAACTPFAPGSRGFFLGEAAMAFVVTSRADRPYLQLRGGRYNHDAYHLVAINPDGAQVARCFRDGAEASGVDPGDVAYVNAHGSGTRRNDSVELAVTERVFPKARLYGTKQLTGHCMAASAAVELAVAALTYDRGFVPGVGCRPGLASAAVETTEPRRPGVTACSAIGIGGYNSVLFVDEANGSVRRPSP